MFKKYFVFIVALWSCLPCIGNAVSNPFTLVRGDFAVRGAAVEVPNMPRVRSQDSVPDCWGFSSATIAQKYICDVEGPERACNPTRDREISPFSMVAWTRTNTDEGGVPNVRNHKNIQFNREGNNAVTALNNARHDFLFLADSCFPHDQFANRYGRNVQSAKKIEETLEIIKREYSKFLTEGSFCEDCLKGAAADFNIQMSMADIKNAMAPKKTFGEFLYKITLGRCPDIVECRPPPGFDMFPKDDKDVSYGKMIDKVKEVLSKGKPLSLDDVCLDYKNGKCGTYHSVVISGYRKMCNSKNECRDVVKVHNSWGEDWQREHDNGWVDAKELMGTSISKNSLAWYY